MTCEDVIREDICEKYLHGQLRDDERDSFEEHFFECRQCFGLLQTYQDMQAELSRTRESGPKVVPAWTSVRRWAWLPAAAVVLLAVSLAILQRPLTEVTNPPATTEARPSDPVPPTSPSVSPGPSLDVLARVEPPSYEAVRLRGTADEATAGFQEAMTHYQQGDYSAAIAGLREAAGLDLEAPHILFFLGVSDLLDGRPDAAIEDLGKAIALGDSAYLEEAHFFLAKAYLQEGRIADAYRELESTVQLGGEREAEAHDLLLQLQSFRGSKPANEPTANPRPR